MCSRHAHTPETHKIGTDEQKKKSNNQQITSAQHAHNTQQHTAQSTNQISSALIYTHTTHTTHTTCTHDNTRTLNNTHIVHVVVSNIITPFFFFLIA